MKLAELEKIEGRGSCEHDAEQFSTLCAEVRRLRTVLLDMAERIESDESHPDIGELPVVIRKALDAEGDTPHDAG